MKAKIGILILIVLFIGASFVPGFTANGAANSGGAAWTPGKFLNANSDAKKKVIEFLRDNYPGLRKEVADYVYKTSPETPAKIRAAGMKMMAEKYPALPVKLPRTVLQDLTKTHPTLIMDIAVDVSTLVSEKYPTMPSDVMKWRSGAKNRQAVKSMIEKKYPSLGKDVQEIIVGKGYAPKIESAKGDLRQMLKQKHPGLIRNIVREARNVVKTKYPDLPGQIADIKDNPNVNPRFAIPELIAKKYPKLIPDVLTAIRDKYGAEIQVAVIDGLELVETKYPELVTDLPRDMSAMMADKYPTLMTDVRHARLTNRQAVMDKVNKKYPNFRKDLKAMMESKYNLAPEIAASVDRNFPDLKKDVAEMMQTQFGGFMDSVSKEIEKKHPGLLNKVSQMLEK